MSNHVDWQGNTVHQFSVVAFHDQLTSEDVPAVAKRLVTATTRVARTTWGVTSDAEPPEEWPPHALPLPDDPAAS